MRREVQREGCGVPRVHTEGGAQIEAWRLAEEVVGIQVGHKRATVGGRRVSGGTGGGTRGRGRAYANDLRHFLEGTKFRQKCPPSPQVLGQNPNPTMNEPRATVDSQTTHIGTARQELSLRCSHAATGRKRL